MYVNPPVIGKLASVVHAYTVNTAIKQILGKKPKKKQYFLFRWKDRNQMWNGLFGRPGPRCWRIRRWNRWVETEGIMNYFSLHVQ